MLRGKQIKAARALLGWSQDDLAVATGLPGGLRAGVLHMNGRDLVHHTVLGDVLYNIIEHEAKAHKADFVGGQFNRIIEAVKSNKISAYFILAGWENCRPKIAGGSIEFPTIITAWDSSAKQFTHYPAIYGEDTCILSRTLRELVSDKPVGKEFPPDIGLGAYFEQERIKRWTTNAYGDAPLGMAARGRVGEYSAHSSAMIKVLDGLGATRGLEQQGTILELDGLTRAMKDKLQLPVETKEIIADNGRNEPYPNIFVTQWSGDGGRQQIVASFTNGISSFTGEPIVRVQITSNGNLPNADILQCALSSLLAAGEDEIRERRWGSVLEQQTRSPLIPLLGSRKEMHQALLAASGDAMFGRKIGAAPLNPIIGCAIPKMRIHTLNEPAIISSLLAMKAKVRELGPHPMLPVIMDFNNMPRSALAFDLNPSTPVGAIKPNSYVSGPVFAFA